MNHYLAPKKSLGQNFLKSKKAIYQMISCVETTADDIVVEIGPGKGALTKPILETGARVIAFELDQRMIEYLKLELNEYIENGQLQLIHKDVLDIDMSEFFGPLGDYKVIANIPYYITNAIMRKFLETEYQPTDMSLLMQREVAERIVVRDGKQSLLSLSVTVFGEPKYIAKVDRKYFSPSPKVHSAIIAIHNISQGKLSRQQQQLFFDILHAGFAHKRKQLLKNLQSLDSKEIWQNIFEQLGISLTIRAEEIDVLKWITIVQYYEKILQEK